MEASRPLKPLVGCHVLVTATSFGGQDPGLRRELEAQVGKVTYNPTGKPLSSAQLTELLPGVDGYIAGLDAIDEAALEAATLLRVIARYGVGVSNVDLQTARRLGVTVSNTPGANSKAVAELTIALVLNLLRPIFQAAIETRQGGWPRLQGFSLEGKTVGLIGLGSIGKEVARRMQGWECRILGYDLDPDGEFASRYGLELLSLDDLLGRADLVSLHLPLLPETAGMVDESFLERMKTGAYLVNTARGELVDEAALLAALQSGKLRGAALDVFSQEPPGKENPLLVLPQVISTPHMGAHTDSATNAMGRMAMQDCLAVLQGQPPLNKVV